VFHGAPLINPSAFAVSRAAREYLAGWPACESQWAFASCEAQSPVYAFDLAPSIEGSRRPQASTIYRGGARRRSFPLRLQPRRLSRQPFGFEALVVFLEFWIGLAVRYLLPRRQRVECPAFSLMRDLLLGGPLRLDHLAFAFSPSSTRRRMASDKLGLSDWLSAHRTTDARIVGEARKPMSGSFPVAGLPRLLGLTFIDFAIN
jgi:hypothetical protein